MARITNLILSLCLLGVTTQGRRYDGYHVVTVMPMTEPNLAFLKQMEGDYADKLTFWSDPVAVGRNVTVVMDGTAYIEVVPQLREAGLHPTLVTSDLQGLIDDERQQTFVPQTRLGGAGPINLNQYNTHAQMNSWLDFLHKSCRRCTVFSIGESYEGRDMKVIKIHTGRTEKPAIWIDAGIHAREWIAPATILYLINKLGNPYKLSNPARQLLNDFDFYILPSANPDGYEYSWNEDRLWRKTRQPTSEPGCMGVDPNRNWAYHWMETGASDNPCSDVYAGPEPFSEPETRAISDYLLENKDKFVAYLTFHAYGQYWLSPWGFTSALPDDYDDLIPERLCRSVIFGDVEQDLSSFLQKDLTKQEFRKSREFNESGMQGTRVANKATHTIFQLTGHRYTVGTSTNVLYAAAGGSDDWAKGVAGIPFSYTIELQDSGYYGFVLPPEVIVPQGDEMWAALRVTAQEIKAILQNAAAGGSDDWAKGVAGIPFSYTIELQDSGWHGFVLPAEDIEPQGREMWVALRSMVNEMKKVLRGRS